MADIISADSHLDFWYLPGDLFVSEAPASMKDRMPRVQEVEGGRAWVYEGRVLRYVGDVGLGRANVRADHAVISGRLERKARTGLYDDAGRGVFRPGSPELRKGDQDRDGVVGEVIYGILGLGHRIQNPQVMEHVYRIYNDFAYQFRQSDPRRYAPLACLPNHDPRVAAAELRRTARMGLTGAELIAAGPAQPIYDRDWDELWQVADETGVPISFHNQGGDVVIRELDPDDPHREENERVRNGVRQAMSRFASAITLSSILLSGAFDRYPGFRFVLAEASIGWIPYLFQRMDYEYEEEEKYHLALTKKPSEYFQSNGYATYERDALGIRLLDILGEDRLMWGSDYPHPDGTWPDSQTFIKAELDDLPATTREKILHDNAARLYKLG